MMSYRACEQTNTAVSITADAGAKPDPPRLPEGDDDGKTYTAGRSPRTNPVPLSTSSGGRVSLYTE